MTPLILVPGTWNRGTAWHHSGSLLWNALEAHGFEVLEFKWSGYCGGVPDPVIVPPVTDGLRGELELWRSEGEKLALYCKAIGVERPWVLSHSHGLQLVMFAAAGTTWLPPQFFDTVLSLSGPVRQDMALTRSQARPNIRKLIQVTDPVSDQTIREGEAFDGHVGWQYHLPEADVNIDAPGHGHSGLTTDPNSWATLGIWDHFAPPPSTPTAVHLGPLPT